MIKRWRGAGGGGGGTGGGELVRQTGSVRLQAAVVQRLSDASPLINGLRRDRPYSTEYVYICPCRTAQSELRSCVRAEVAVLGSRS